MRKNKEKEKGDEHQKYNVFSSSSSVGLTLGNVPANRNKVTPDTTHRLIITVRAYYVLYCLPAAGRGDVMVRGEVIRGKDDDDPCTYTHTQQTELN